MHNYYFSEPARQDLNNLSYYLLNHWSIEVLERIIYELEQLILRIRENPFQFMLISARLGLRKCVLNKQNTVYYKVRENSIEIVRIFDTRQHPDKLTFTL